jgi:hypothetical protein
MSRGFILGDSPHCSCPSRESRHCEYPSPIEKQKFRKRQTCFPLILKYYLTNYRYRGRLNFSYEHQTRGDNYTHDDLGAFNK